MNLTRREHDVMRLRASGMPVKSVAARLGTSEQTVKNQTHRALVKLGATCLLEGMNALGWVRTGTHDEYVRRQVEREEAAHRARLAAIEADARDAEAEWRFLQPINPDPVTPFAKARKW